jgi:hypothetical protein
VGWASNESIRSSFLDLDMLLCIYEDWNSWFGLQPHWPASNFSLILQVDASLK